MTLGRWLRFVVKELRETLRDKRTLVTLVGMPLLLYPLLNVVVQQLLLGGARGRGEVVYRIGVRSETEGRAVLRLLRFAGPDDDAPRGADAGLSLPGAPPPQPPKLEFVDGAETHLKAALQAGDLQALVKLDPPGGLDRAAPGGWTARATIETLDGSGLGRAAAEALERRFARANRHLLEERLRQLGVPQGPEALAVARRGVPDPQGRGGIPLAVLLPLALALMTATGAVYPAIDLTAGERERGTLEALMCTPAPKFAVLAAKYVAVCAVAMLTAAINLLALGATIAVSDLGPALFAPGALSWRTAAYAGVALALFAAFFSAALLAVSCFARSFKEAQAYLIPLMLVALVPGLASLLPNVELTPLAAATPMLNVVLLARDLFRGEASGPIVALVAGCNLLYAAAALALAARAFGAEGILYGGSESWTSLFRRPPPETGPTLASALVALAAAPPLFLVGNGLVNRLAESPGVRLGASAAVNVLAFAGLPLALAWWRRWRLRDAYALRAPPAPAWLAAALVGFLAWPAAVEVEGRAAAWLGPAFDFQNDPALKARLETALRQLTELPLALRLAAIAVVPAACEELFFRGLLFGALRRRGPWLALLGSALAFAAFHVVGPSGLTLQRFAPTLLLGLLLGWARWRSGSLWPGLLAHLLHNGLLAWAVARPELINEWLGLAGDELRMPPALLALSAVALAAAAAWWHAFRRRP